MVPGIGYFYDRNDPFCLVIVCIFRSGTDKKLPLLKPALAFIGFVFLMRGLLAIPAIYLLDSPYMAELKAQITLMTVTSVICLVLARGYIKGFLLHR